MSDVEATIVGGLASDSGNRMKKGGSMLRIWGRENSSNVRKVLWCCGELGITFERIDIGGARFGGLDSPKYLARNPNHAIPTIEDNEFVLWESNAILRYLSSKYGAGTLYPMDLRERADADRWLDWQLSTLRPPLIPLVLDWIYERPLDPELCRETEWLWQILDERLADRAFLIGDRFTMADIPVALMANWWYEFPIEDHFKMPHLQRWYANICERPAFKDYVLDKSYGPKEDH